MKAPTPARGLLLAAACISALQGGCSWSSGGPPPGYDPNRSAGAKPVQQTQQKEQGQPANHASSAKNGQSGNFGSVVNGRGVAGCMSITEDQVPVNYFETVGVATAAGGILLALLGAAAGAIMSKDSGRGATQGAIIGGAV